MWESRTWRPLRVHLALRDLARAAHRVDLVEEDDARRRRPRRREEVADAPRADADVLLVERRAARREERHARLARHARARSVLPVPGCPSRRKPRGIFAPSRPKRSGSRRYSTTSTSSAFTSSTPSTSAKRSVAFVTVWYVELPAAVRFGLSSEPSAPPRPPRSLDAVSTRTDTHAASTLKTPRTTSSAKRSPSGSSCSRSRARDVGPIRRCVLVGRRTVHGGRRTAPRTSTANISIWTSPATAGPAVPVEPKV